jgi:methylated-DNA-[protein]-cysteine S-methyltransferase
MSENIAIYRSPIGPLTIKANDKAITAVLFLRQPGMPDPEGWLPQQSVYDNPLLTQCCQQLDEYFAGTRKIFSLSLAQDGTDFQQNVWLQLVQIPFGKTISYLELSKRIGDVKAIRAVGTTNGKNKIAIIVPCHRVIGSDGTLTGYAGGLWRKHWLLQHEDKYQNGVQTLF